MFDVDGVRTFLGRIAAVVLYLGSLFVWISLLASDGCAYDSKLYLCTEYINNPEYPTVLEVMLFMVLLLFAPSFLYILGGYFTFWLFEEYIFECADSPERPPAFESPRLLLALLGSGVRWLWWACSWAFYVIWVCILGILLVAWPFTLGAGMVIMGFYFGVCQPIAEFADKFELSNF